jgi:hypothetical protein
VDAELDGAVSVEVTGESAPTSVDLATLGVQYISSESIDSLNLKHPTTAHLLKRR